MKYGDFARLCARECVDTRDHPGSWDLTGLSLTDESAAELAQDITDNGIVFFLRPGDAVLPDGCFTGRLQVNRLQNPATRSEVAITHGAESDTATVSCRDAGGPPGPRTVAIA